MKLFGMTVPRLADLIGRQEINRQEVEREEKGGSLVPASNGGGGWIGSIRESFAGAWQRNVEVESPQNILAFSAVYACVSLISDDIAKLRIKLVSDQDNGIQLEVKSGSPFNVVLRKPNRYQTRIQFLSQWITSKLLHGNTYILKDRDLRGVVFALYVLDPRLVLPLVAEDGSVWYQIKKDRLSGIEDSVTVPADEIIHDRGLTPWHPLVGVSPILACGSSATQGIRIQNNSARFFENMSRPSGHLTAPGVISPTTVERLKKEFETNFSGGNLGRLFVTGDNLKYEAMTIPAHEAQLIEQLQWTVSDVGRAFHVPLHKLGGQGPTFNNVGALNQDYYSQCLQILIEAIEILLDEGLSLPTGLSTELDLEGLLRTDPLARAERLDKLKNTMTPNESRLTENLPPVKGGDSVYRQQQDFSLEALAKRDAKADPFATNKPTAPPSAPDTTPTPPAPADGAPPAEGKGFDQFMSDMQAFELAAEIRKGLTTK